MEVISSLDNEKVKYFNRLNDKKFRDMEDFFLIEGDHLVKEAYEANQLVEVIELTTCELKLDVKVTYVTEQVMKKISKMDSYSDIIGLARKFKPLQYGNRLLLLDGIQDPGNLGTIIRSACAFNIDTIILGNGCVDLYNDKVIRATEGLLFHIDIMKMDLVNLIGELIKNNYEVYGTDVNNGTNLSNIKWGSKFGIVIGNEGNGVNRAIRDEVKENIYIPINNATESLNAAVATSIILYEMSKIDYE